MCDLLETTADLTPPSSLIDSERADANQFDEFTQAQSSGGAVEDHQLPASFQVAATSDGCCEQAVSHDAPANPSLTCTPENGNEFHHNPKPDAADAPEDNALPMAGGMLNEQLRELPNGDGHTAGAAEYSTLQPGPADGSKGKTNSRISPRSTHSQTTANHNRTSSPTQQLKVELPPLDSWNERSRRGGSPLGSSPTLVSPMPVIRRRLDSSCLSCGESFKDRSKLCVCATDSCARPFCMQCIQYASCRGMPLVNSENGLCAICNYQSEKRRNVPPQEWHWAFNNHADLEFARILRDALPTIPGLFLEIHGMRQGCWRRRIGGVRKHYSFKQHGGFFEGRLQALEATVPLNDYRGSPCRIVATLLPDGSLKVVSAGGAPGEQSPGVALSPQFGYMQPGYSPLGMVFQQGMNSPSNEGRGRNSTGQILNSSPSPLLSSSYQMGMGNERTRGRNSLVDLSPPSPAFKRHRASYEASSEEEGLGPLSRVNALQYQQLNYSPEAGHNQRLLPPSTYNGMGMPWHPYKTREHYMPVVGDQAEDNGGNGYRSAMVDASSPGLSNAEGFSSEEGVPGDEPRCAICCEFVTTRSSHICTCQVESCSRVFCLQCVGNGASQGIQHFSPRTGRCTICQYQSEVCQRKQAVRPPLAWHIDFAAHIDGPFLIEYCRALPSVDGAWFDIDAVAWRTDRETFTVAGCGGFFEARWTAIQASGRNRAGSDASAGCSQTSLAGTSAMQE